MIKKLGFIILIILMSALFLVMTEKRDEYYKVIKIVEGDKFYLDLNRNNKEDSDELFHLKDVNSFPLKYNNKIELYKKRFGLSKGDIFALGYLGKIFSEEFLLNKYVKIDYIQDYNPDFEYRFITIRLKGIDYSLILLENGLGFSYGGINNNFYKDYESPEKIKENLKKLEKYNLKIVDDENKVFHELNCPFAYKNQYISISPRAKIQKDYKKCEYCYIKSDYKERIKEFLSKIEISNLYKKLGDFELFLLYPNSYYVKTGVCRTQVCKEVVKNINNTKKTIDFALYGFEGQDEIFNALLKAQRRGVKIRGVLDSDSGGENIYKNTSFLIKSFQTKSDKTTNLMHNKFIIFDNKIVFTGSANFSSSGLGSYNSNSSFIIKNPEVANAYECEFNQMFKGKFGVKKEIDCSKSDIKISDNFLMSVYFSPKGNLIENVFEPVIRNAESEILISIFYLTNKNVTDELIKAKKRGVDVKIIMDATSAFNPKTSLKLLRNAAIPVKIENWGGKNHEKTMLIDGKILIMGSANFTNSGIKRNDENLVVIRNSEIGKFYKHFFNKLYSSIDNKYLKEIPKAEGLDSGYSCYDGMDNDYDGKIDEKDESCQKFFE